MCRNIPDELEVLRAVSWRDQVKQVCPSEVVPRGVSMSTWGRSQPC